ncbi:MAG: hypothetical protein M1835_006266 [Candelina submexicana]|nr:MAG: hypothetical protein M1835_006266 [Candelina submexicana]
MTTFDSVDLFGGAMVADLPSGFADVSDIRQVPDNQEVYLDKDGFTSIIIDITERVDDSLSDEAALRFHFKDVVESGEGVKVWSTAATTCSQLPTGTPAYSLFATQYRASGHTRGSPSPDFTEILMTLVRLQAQKTDLVITINAPYLQGQSVMEDPDLEQGRVVKHNELALSYRDHLLRSLVIRDWTLFV